MKILVLSLLRIGDIVLSAPALRGLREKYPEAEIHLLINKQFAGIAPLLPYIDRVLHFDRAGVQKGLGEATIPFFDSYERLTELIDELNHEGYDSVVNLTHSRLSGWLMSLIDAPEKLGLSFDVSGRPTFGSNWFRYLNNQVEAESDEVFHFTDVFRFALGLEDEVHLPALIETEHGRAEAETALADMGSPLNVIAVQALTSDSKKDWGFENFRRALGEFARAQPEARIAIVGAPFERERLQPLVDFLRDDGVKAHLAILSFEGAFSFLKRSRLLLTGDTSIMHLASASKTPIIEISIGSSDYHRTGAYLSGAVIVQSREICAPCSHSKSCHRASHACAERVPADAIAMVLAEIYEGRSFQLRAIAEEFKDEIEILRVQSRNSGFWAAYSVLEPFTEEAIAHWIDLTSRKLWLACAREPALEPAMRGTEIRRLAQFLLDVHPSISNIEWKHLLADFERQLMSVEGRMNGFRLGLRALHTGYEDPRVLKDYVRGLIAFREKMRLFAVLRSYRGSLDQIIEDDISPAFVRLRRIVDGIGEIDRRTRITLALVRGLSERLSRAKEIESL
jgi:ADP-heptose:LPS heptosyltransferase